MKPEEMSLEKLLNKWDDEDGYASARSAGDEMARRLRLLGKRHSEWRGHNSSESICGGCHFSWPCPEAEILGVK